MTCCALCFCRTEAGAEASEDDDDVEILRPSNSTLHETEFPRHTDALYFSISVIASVFLYLLCNNISTVLHMQWMG